MKDKRCKAVQYLRRVLCLLLCFVLLGLPEALGQEETEAQTDVLIRHLKITNKSQFLRFAQRCILDSYSKNLQVTLTCDLDLSGTDFNGIPIFCGSFEGNGHTITGLSLQPEGSSQGLFRYLSRGAVVKNLNVEGEIRPDGSRCKVGAIAGSNAGTIHACRGQVTVSGSEKVGGLVGENLVTGTVEACVVKGKVTGSHFVGGIVGNNMGVVLRSRNEAEVNTSPEENEVILSEVTLESLMGSEAVNTSTDVGGVVGSNQGVIRNCYNNGRIGYRQMGYNVGGIAGTQKGYITNCTNRGDISGRKEVGGVVGQMEPVAYIVFEEDMLQILNGQLDGLSGIVGQAAGNAQMVSGAIGGQVSTLMTQVENTKSALGALMENEGLNYDSLEAARNILSSGMSDMTQTMSGMAATTMGALGVLTNSIYAMQGQINAMRTTLGNASETMGGVVKDLSDQDTPDQHNGKVENCRNEGCISGDLNVGGIAGLIAPENDLDIREDYTLGENNSLNFVSELRAVILNCENEGDVLTKREAGGGIVGSMLLGLVKYSRNTGDVQGENARYMGGIAGNSKSFLRDNSAKCRVNGERYVGGIAGEGSTVSDCRSMALLQGQECVGAILGYGVQEQDEEGNPKIRGNLYLYLEEDPGGIDGVSYNTAAQPLEKGKFYMLEGLPALFGENRIHFVQEDGTVHTLTVPVDQALDREKLPKVKEKPGYIAGWDGFEAIPYAFSQRFRPKYIPMSSTIASETQGAEGYAMLLAEGSFFPETRLQYRPMTLTPQLSFPEEPLLSGFYETEDGSRASCLRFYIGQEVDGVKAYAHLADGRWQEIDCTVLGSYAAVTPPENADCVAFSHVRFPLTKLIWVSVAALLLLLVRMLSLAQRNRRKRRSRSRRAGSV